MTFFACRSSPQALSGPLSQSQPIVGLSEQQLASVAGSGRCINPNVDVELGMEYQLGDGTTASRTTSATISGLTGTQVVAGGSFTCALTTTGQPQCWGADSAGQVGDGTGILRSTPSTVGGGNYTFASLSPGYGSVCGITAGFDLYCWGDNSSGQLGDGTVNTAFAPVKVQMQ